MGITETVLHKALRETQRVVKTERWWISAGKRWVTNWLAADHGSSSPYGFMLSHHLDAVLEALLIMSRSELFIIDFEVFRFKSILLGTLERL